MKVKKNLQRFRKRILKMKAGGGNFRKVILAGGLFLIAASGMIGIRALVKDGKNEVYAASDGAYQEEMTNTSLPTGLAGVMAGVQNTPAPGSTVNRIGSSCEKVMVGQRTNTIRGDVTEFDISRSMRDRVDDMDARAVSSAASARMMSDRDYENLLAIVEAEAGTEDIKGRVLVANVIMNRVKHSEFPDNVTEVVWQSTNGVPQFSPTYDGRISQVTITDETREAVRQALDGVDYSEGALFFIQKSAAESHNVKWFEKDLKKLFKYGVHEFYTYPDENDRKENSSDSDKEKIVQMVKK